MNGVQAVVRMLRLSLAPTLIADLAAGMALAACWSVDLHPDVLSWWSAATGWRLLAALGSSVLLFSGGMALNAWVDLDEDGLTRPERPLPAGDLRPRTALILALVGLLGAPLLGWCAATEHRGEITAWLCGVSFCIALYHTPLRRQPLLGPLILGMVRGGHLLFGVVIWGGFELLHFPVLMAGAGYCAYVLGASLVAHQEDRRPDPRMIRAGAFLALAAMWIPLLVALGPWHERAPSWAMQAAAGLVALVHARPVVGVLRGMNLLTVDPPRVGMLAGMLLGRMTFYAAATCFAGGSAILGLAALAAGQLVRLAVRWIPPT